MAPHYPAAIDMVHRLQMGYAVGLYNSLAIARAALNVGTNRYFDSLHNRFLTVGEFCLAWSWLATTS